MCGTACCWDIAPVISMHRSHGLLGGSCGFYTMYAVVCGCVLLFAAGANGDLAVINGVLQTANSIFKRYRDQYRSNALVNELAATQVSCSRVQGFRFAQPEPLNVQP
jgi:hypothetical protein